jgi:glycosyltransferase involved in cell wall biosynthesis
MRNLLSINNYHYRRGGSDVVYFEHAKLVESVGWNNAFFSMHHPKNEDSEWSEFFVEEIEFGHSYSLIDKLSKAAKTIYSIEARRNLDKLIAKYRPDIAHLHCIYHHLSPSFISLLKDSGIPVVMTAHDLKIACPAYKMLNRQGICERCKTGNVLNVAINKCIRNSFSASALVALESATHKWLGLYKNLDRIIVPSKFFLEKFVEWGWPRSKFVYIPNFVKADTFEPEYSAGNYFIYFGRLAPEKGLATLINAAKISGTALKIVGTGPESESLQKLASSLNVDIEFCGYQSGTALHTLVRRSRAVVLPSEWYENAPMSVLESFAMGKPVIGADIGGIPELVIPNQTGWRFISGDAASLASSLSYAANLPDIEISKLGKSARQFVEHSFNEQVYADRTLSLYRELLSN